MARLTRLKCLSGLLVPLALVGCSVENRGDPADRGYAEPSVTGPDGVRPPDDVPRDDMTDESIAPWTSFEEAGPAALRVSFTAGTTGCYGTRAAVREEGDEILIETIVGTIPEAHSACPDVGRAATLLVELEDDVGDREVRHLDGDGLLRQ